MVRSVVVRLIPVILGFVLYGCANPLPPVGGPRDEVPPLLVPEASTPNYQTNFRPRTIELTFDEWIKLQEVQQQIVVSPPLEFPIDVRLRRRTVVFHFDEREQLRDSVTYIINFGTAVRDLTESNPAEDLRFVFATGPVIDSLRVSGQVIDAYTGEPVGDVLFLLYADLRDSAVALQLPFYFARTDSAGRYTVSNVRAGTYRGIALEDAGGDYRYTLPGERIGFPDSLVVVDSDTATVPPVRFFLPRPPLRRLQADSSAYGLLRLAFNQPPPPDLTWRAEGLPGPLIPEINGDTLRLYYDAPPDTRATLYLQTATGFNDTLRLRAGNRAAFLQNDTLRTVSSPQPGRHNPARPFSLTFTRPLTEVDTTRLQLTADTTNRPVAVRAFNIDSTLGRRRLDLLVNWENEQRYDLVLLPGAVTDLHGRTHPDTIRRTFTTDARRNLGNLSLTFTSPDSAAAYVVQLVGQQNTVLATYRLSGDTTYQRDLTSLAPGNYRLEIIQDRNNNGRYDPGDYYAGRQPETVVIRQLEPLRANWDLEAEVDLGVGGEQ